MKRTMRWTGFPVSALIVVVAVTGVGLGTAYGIAAARYELFPYALARSAWNAFSGEDDGRASGSAPSGELLETEFASFERLTFQLSEPTALDRRGGGALAQIDSGVLGVDKWGEFFVWTRGSGLRSLGRKIETGIAPLQAKTIDLLADSTDDGLATERLRGLNFDDPAVWNLRSFRVTDLHVVPGNENAVGRIFVAYSYWHEDRQCKSLRVAALTVPAGSTALAVISAATPTDWQLLHETQPCIPFSYRYNSGFQSTNTGGRLLQLDAETLLFTVGDHHLDGVNSEQMVSQDSASDYGKILTIHPSSGARGIFAMGLRNPQGLTRDVAGRLWETEHGPEGGDELNLLQRGRNYGWPLVTHGRQYSAASWPLNGTAQTGTSFEPSVYSWVPSIAPSNLVRIADRPANWAGDIVVSSLRASSLFRLRFEGARVAYVEQIPFGARIRDMELLSTGELALWLDTRELVILREASATDGAAPVFPVAFTAAETRSGLPEAMQVCASCHSLRPGQSSLAAPSLFGVVGRDIASTSFPAYSRALTSLSGMWSPDRLREFLLAPERVAPGTTMASQAVQDPALAGQIVQYLNRSQR